MSGLSRRRVGHAANGARGRGLDDDEDASSSPAQGGSSSTAGGEGGEGGGGGSSGSLANGGGPSRNRSVTGTSISAGATSMAGVSAEGKSHRVAYDPRDLETADEERKRAKLTLMEEVLLLGLKDKQGYLSFWNDNISYTLRGCILIELALRGRIGMIKDVNRRRYPLADRFIEVIDEKMTGEVLLDEALKMMRASEKMSVGSWIDLMSGETWNVMKIGYQLKQVRERLAKGLVDKGVLRTEKRNFLLFDMATHPVSDPACKEEVVRRVMTLLTTRATQMPATRWYPEGMEHRTFRAVILVCAAYAANVLENVLNNLSFDPREKAYAKTDELLADFAQYPFAVGGRSAVGEKNQQVGYGSQDVALRIRDEISEEQSSAGELSFEIVAAVLNVYARMDSLI